MFRSAYIYIDFSACLDQNINYIAPPPPSLLIIFTSQMQSFPDPAKPISLLIIQISNKEKITLIYPLHIFCNVSCTKQDVS